MHQNGALKTRCDRSLPARRQEAKVEHYRGDLIEVAAQAAASLIADRAWIRNDIAGRYHTGGRRCGAAARGMSCGQGLERRRGRHARRIRKKSLGAATSAGADANRLALDGLGAGRATDRIAYLHQQAGGILVGRCGRSSKDGRRRRGDGVDGATAGAAQEQDQE